ncbi:MAG TPA: hypothetical protein H9775_10015 [Candidatus Blautia merdipullorum]|nr:hypothetical protein [Candidatus Blautia merdipullorum]
MKNKTQRFIGIFLSICVILGTCMPVYAAEEVPRLGEVVDGSVLIDDISSESNLYNRARGNILNRGFAKITNNGDGSVNVYGAVLPAVKCDTLTLKMTIQRLENGSWANVKTYSDVVSNTTYLSKSYNYNVKGGYYYRLKAACVAVKGSTSESLMPITDGLWID